MNINKFNSIQIPAAQVSQNVSDSKIKQIIKKMFDVLQTHKQKAIFFGLIGVLYILHKRGQVLNFQKLLTIAGERMMKQMEQEMSRRNYYQSKHQNFASSSNGFFQVDFNYFKSDLRQIYLDHFRIDELKARLTDRSLAFETQKQVFQQLTTQVFSLLASVLLSYRVSILAFYIPYVLKSKYQEEFQGYFENNTQWIDQILQQFVKETFQTGFKELTNQINQRSLEQLSNIASNTEYTSNMIIRDVQNLMQASTNVVKKQNSSDSLAHPTKLSTQLLVPKAMQEVHRKFIQNPLDQSLTQQKPAWYQRIIPALTKQYQKLVEHPESLHGTDLRYQPMECLFNSTPLEISNMNIQKLVHELEEKWNSHRIPSYNSNIEQKNNKIEREINLQESSKDNEEDIVVDEQDHLQRGKQFTELLLFELRDILKSQNMNIFFKYAVQYDLNRFQNRLLIYFNQTQEADQKMFINYITLIYRILQEEYINIESESTCHNFYNSRFKSNWKLVMAQEVEQMKSISKSNDQQESQSPLKAIQSSTLNSPAVKQDKQELILNLFIMQQAYNEQIMEESLMEISKRIFFEREQFFVGPIMKPSEKEESGDIMKMLSFNSDQNSSTDGNDYSNPMATLFQSIVGAGQ